MKTQLAITIATRWFKLNSIGRGAKDLAFSWKYLLCLVFVLGVKNTLAGNYEIRGYIAKGICCANPQNVTVVNLPGTPTFSTTVVSNSFSIFVSTGTQIGFIYSWEVSTIDSCDNVFLRDTVSVASGTSASSPFVPWVVFKTCKQFCSGRLHVITANSPMIGFNVSNLQGFDVTTTIDLGDGSTPFVPSSSSNQDYHFYSPGTYQTCLQVRNPYSCAYDTCVTLTIPPSTAITYGNLYHNRRGGTDYFSARSNIYASANLTTVGNNSVVSYWNYGDGVIDTFIALPDSAGITYFNGSLKSHTYNKPGIYHVCITREIYHFNTLAQTTIYCDSIYSFASGCRTAFSYGDFGTTSNQVVFFSHGPAYPNLDTTETYFWNFGDGTTDTSYVYESGAYHTYASPGAYNVCLTTDNSWGCQVTHCDSVNVPNDAYPFCRAAFSSWQIESDEYLFAGYLFPHGYSDSLNDNGNDPTGSYFWDFGDGTTSTALFEEHTFSSPGNYNVCLTGTDTAGCSDTYCKQIMVAGVASCSAAFTFSYFQSAYTFQNTSTGNNLSYLWNFGDGTTSTLESPSHTYASGSYSVCLIISDTSGCSDTTCTGITVANTQNLVWPGDANSDGIANVWDVLAIGIGYGISGPARLNATTNWIGQPATDWQLQFLNGVNLKHADCDGNALIDSNDVAVVSLNYGFTHQKGGSPDGRANADLYFEFPQDSANAGDSIVGSIYLGTSPSPVSNIYGIAFSLLYNQNIIDSGSLRIDFTNSWFTPNNNRISLTKDLYLASKIDAGLSRIDHTNISGAGKIADVSFVIQDNIDGKDFLVLPLEIQFENVLAIDKDEAAVSLLANGDTLYVKDEISSIGQINQRKDVRIFPNPATNQVYIVADFVIAEYSLLDLAGKEIIKPVSSFQTTNSLLLDVFAVESGSYLIRLKNADGFSECRKIVVMK